MTKRDAKGPGGKSFRKGDHVSWDTLQGETRGTVQKKLTSRTRVKGHEVAASCENPEYLVRSHKTGQEAAHKPSALRKRSKGRDTHDT